MQGTGLRHHYALTSFPHFRTYLPGMPVNCNKKAAPALMVRCCLFYGVRVKERFYACYHTRAMAKLEGIAAPVTPSVPRLTADPSLYFVRVIAVSEMSINVAVLFDVM